MELWRMEYSHCSSRSAFKALRRDSRSAAGVAANNDAVRNGVSARMMRERSIEPPAGFRRDHQEKGDQGSAETLWPEAALKAPTIGLRAVDSDRATIECCYVGPARGLRLAVSLSASPASRRLR